MSRDTPDQASSGRPVYLQIEDHLRRRIVDGGLELGARLPSESELARMFATTRPTVRQALARLVFEGLVKRHAGRGSFVSEPVVDRFPIDSRMAMSFEEQAALRGRRVTYERAAYQLVPVPQDMKGALAIDIEDTVFRLERLRMIDTRPICIESRYIPTDLGRHVTGEMLVTRSAHDFMSEIVGARIPTIRVVVSAVSATPRQAELLGVPAGAALMVRENVHFDQNGRPVMAGASVFRGDVKTQYVLGHDPDPPRLPYLDDHPNEGR